MTGDKTQQTIQYLSAIFDQSADGLMIADNKGVILKMNRAAERLNAVRSEDLVGRDVMSLVKDGSINRSATQEVLESKRQVSVIQRAPGSEYTLLVTGTPVFDDKGNLSFVVVNERDISLIESMQKELERARLESEKMKDELKQVTLLELTQNDIVAQSNSMKQTLRIALKLAIIDASNILIQGESGTGKGLLAKFIHKNSGRSSKPFIQINCAALPENLLEAELFGYVKGAFTGASEHGRTGLLELAADGTLFLDEIGEMPKTVQAKLLKYLDDHEIRPIGGTESKQAKCTIIAATNRDLDRLTRQNKFRLDLLHRLNVFTLPIPPLRERPEDILDLVGINLKKYNKKYNRRAYIDYRGFECLKKYDFPGNVRELINIIKQAIVMCDKRYLDDYIINSLESVQTGHSPSQRQEESNTDQMLTLPEQLNRFERQILEHATYKYETTRQAAKFLGVSQPSVVRKFKKHGLTITKK
ncbi:MAG: sigma 54-interacting transcriptional regulator [Desulfobacterales bacterium]|nr:sigma 54-interacting transcriptional regulator [Desulfobacterales bacterium]